MKWLKIVFSTLIFTIAIATGYAQETCQLVVEEMVENAQTACADIGDNQACYGNRFVLGTPSVTGLNTKFLESGDMIDLIDMEKYETQPFSSSEDSWGIMKSRVVLETGEAVEMIAFGSQYIWDATRTSPVQYTGTITTGSNLLKTVADFGTAFYPTTVNDTVTVTATEQNGQWVRVIDKFGNAGWVESTTVSFAEDIFTLPQIQWGIFLDPTTLPLMQGIYLSRVMGMPDCVDVPIAGVMIQTLDNEEPLSVWVNSVNIELNGTVYITAGVQEEMWIEVLDGQAQLNEAQFVTCAGDNCKGITIPAGARATLPLTQLYAVLQPKLSAYDIENANKLPLTLLTQPIDLPTQLTPAEIQAAQ